MTVKIISPDPFGYLIRRTGLKPIAFGFIIFCINLMIDAYLGWRYDAFLTTTGAPGLLQDSLALVSDLVYFPVSFAVYLWLLPGAETMFSKLLSSGIFKDTGKTKILIQQQVHQYNQQWLVIAAFVLGALFTVSQILAYQNKLPWKTVGGYLDIHPDMCYWRAVFWFFGVYILTMLFLNVIITVRILGRVLKSQEIQLQPLHPDHCGGLRPISEFSRFSAFIIAPLGLMISLGTIFEINNNTLNQAAPVIFAIAVYILIAPLVFFLPYNTAHQVMREAKNKELSLISMYFKQKYASVINTMKQDKPTASSDVQSLTHTADLYQMVESFPVWPFDARSIRNFFTIVILPLLPLALEPLIRWLVQV